jgi:tetratricopeptide (TPR) repeat protein
MRNPGITISGYRVISFVSHVKQEIAVFVVACMFCVVGTVGAQSNPLEKGEQLFLENRLEEALPLLETASIQNPRNERVYIYLGTIYERLGQFEKAVTILQRGTLVAERYLDLMYFNIGNNLFKQNKLVLAEEMYTKASSTNPQLADVYLNRANTRVKMGTYPGAVEDYRVYLNLRPETEQRENIEKILALLTAEIDAELARLREEEERKAAEAARQKALLDEVLSSLQKAVEDTKSLSVETEGIEEVQEESDIVD